ncbi:LacI family DNA-binding transcriptional regulator [Silvibacterium sp.]|uniref:LacI family DNA-binding transcriptional regulator n=1 Tax=Silvibacterium sp. TaxID=1964179 RepID=UPI0039E55312
MAAKSESGKKGRQPLRDKPVRLKELAEYLGLNPSTISVVLNDTPGRSIPEATRQRIKEAAQKLNYQPNLVARSFRNRRTLTIGIMVPVLSDGYHTEIMTGAGDCLVNAGYFYFTAHHRHRPALVDQYSRQLVAKGAEGLICIDTAIEHPMSVPVVAVAGHRHVRNVTNVVLDHRRAAELAIQHLYSLGHRRIAFMHGQPFSSDSNDRWQSMVDVCRELGLPMHPELIMQLDRDISTPELGYPVVEQLVKARRKFTALVCFNDIAAIGAIRGLRDLGLRVPEDVSVIGFDDIKAAAFLTPGLTTIRQPLAEMGRFAAQYMVNRLNQTEEFREQVAFEPELIVRESTAPPHRS